MDLRPSKKQYYLDIAKAVSKRASCLKRSYGAVLMKDDVIIATGYNGPPRGQPHCGTCSRADKPSGVDYSDCPAVHAEENCIANAARAGHTTIGSILYLYGDYPPCNRCERLLKNAGVLFVVTKTNVFNLQNAYAIINEYTEGVYEEEPDPIVIPYIPYIPVYPVQPYPQEPTWITITYDDNTYSSSAERSGDNNEEDNNEDSDDSDSS